MAVIAVEGFKGYPLETGMTYLTSSLLQGPWALQTTVNAAYTASSSAQSYDVAVDPIFGDRAVMRFQNTASTSLLAQSASWDYGLTTAAAKVILGFTMTLTSPVTPPTVKYDYQFGVGPAGIHVVGTAPTDSRFFFLVNFNGTAAAPSGTINVPGTTAIAATWEWNRQYHVELFLESDTNRIRMYLDGTLVADATYAGTAADLTKGFSFYRRKAVGGIFVQEMSNIYAVQVDSVHTGPFGPAARVIEAAPTADATVQFQRDETKYASNAAVVGQNYSSADFVSAMDNGTKDLFAGPSTVAGSAAQIFGVAIKVKARSFTTAGHNLRSKVSFNGVELDNTVNMPLLVTAPTTFVRDASINPQTSAKWAPSEIATAQFGYMLYN